MTHHKPAQTHDDPDAEDHLPGVADDEEAQLLDAEDYEQYELAAEGTTTTPPVQQHHPRRRQRAPPRWLAFLRGPNPPPKPHSFSPLLPAVQERPAKWLRALLPRTWQRGVLLLFLILAFWGPSLAVPLVRSKGAVIDAGGGAPVRHASCADAPWRDCGLDGERCRPFGNVSFAVRCPAGCAAAAMAHGGRRVDGGGYADAGMGDDGTVAAGPPWVVGGGAGSPCRGDSGICAAAVHAGVFVDEGGGCAVVRLVGGYYQYFPAEENGVVSRPFLARFPMSFAVLPPGEGISCTKPDPRGGYGLLVVSVGFTALLVLGGAAPAVVFTAATVAASVHVSMVADPPDLATASSATLLPALAANAVAVLLPTLLAAALLYRTGLARTLSVDATAAVEKTILWVLPFWAAAVTPLPLRSGSATINLVVAILAAVAAAALVVIQTRTLYREGRLVGYLAFYAGAAGVVGVLALLVLLSKGLALRREGWVVLTTGLLLPLTGTQTRVGMVGQGVLMGVLVGGLARSGGGLDLFSVVVREGEVAFPTVLPPVIEWLGTVGDLAGGMRIRFKFLEEQKGVGAEGISVLVNDVERFRGWAAEKALGEQVFAWTKPEGVVGDEFFRFGYLREGGRVLRYSEAGTWFANGSWSQGVGYW